MPPGLSRHIHHAVQALHILLGKISLIIVEKIAIVRREGIGIQHAVHTGGLRRQVFAADLLMVRHRVQRACCRQCRHLIVRKGKHICPILQIPQQHILAV